MASTLPETLKTKAVRALYGITIALAAGLLFWQQLMLGRVLLPQFGSVPTVWLVSLAVFQLLLLAAYALAHGAGRLPAGILFFPLAALIGGSIWQQLNFPDLKSLPMAFGNDAPSVALALLGLAGFSLFLLSMLSPLLQRLYSRLPQPDAADPYFFYSASNLGSFAGLLIFPLLLEPLWGVSFSQALWRAAAALLAVLLLFCLGVSLKSPGGMRPAEKTATPTNKKLLWLFYAFLPAALSFGATSHLINDIAPVPLLSMVPLALYLLTYVLAFSRRANANSEWITIVHPFLVAFYVYREILSGFKPSQLFDIVLVLAVFFLTAWRCHRRLAELRPETGSLTTYYLMIALGGALGGILNVAVIPFIFSIPIEFVIFLILSLFSDWNADRSRILDKKIRPLLVVMAVIGISALGSIVFSSVEIVSRFIFPVVVVLALSVMTLLPNVLAVFSAVLVALTLAVAPPHVTLQRDFFGVKNVQDKRLEDGSPYRMLFHGTTCHGIQRLKPLTTEALLYYAPGGGFYDAMEVIKPQHFGVVGLGAGTVACIPPKGTDIRFFEIDPGMVQLAKDDFTFLKNCPADIVMGDARLTLAEDTHTYDLMLIDAFSSDAIPVHLLTRQAFDIYRERMGKDGVLVVHISNRFLDLRPVVAGAAKYLGWAGAVKHNDPNETRFTASASEYVILSANAEKIAEITKKDGWKPLADVEPLLWTDDHIVLIPILHFGFHATE